MNKEILSEFCHLESSKELDGRKRRCLVKWPSPTSPSGTQGLIKSALRAWVSQTVKWLNKTSFLCGSIKTKAKGETFNACHSGYKYKALHDSVAGRTEDRYDDMRSL